MTKESVFAPFMDPCDIYLPQDVTGELLRCATANGRISYEYLLAIYRAGVAAGKCPYQSKPKLCPANRWRA